MVGAISGTVRELVQEAAVHEQRDDEQHHRHGNLAADQQRPPPAPAPARRDAVACLHHGHQIRARRVNRRHEAEEHGADDGDDEAERHRAAIHPEREHDRKIRWHLDLPEQRHARVPDAEPRDAAGDCKQQALGDQLPYEPAAAGADGEAQRHLARARRRAAGEQPRHVRARDEQHGERERRQHREQRRVRRILRHPRLQFGSHRKPPVVVRVGIGALQIGADRRQLGLRGRLRHAGTKASLDGQVPDAARFERTALRIADEPRRHHERHEEIGSHVLIEAGELGWRDADDGELVAVDSHAPAKHRRIRSQLLFPQPPADDDDGVASWYLVFIGSETASDRRLDAHERQEVPAQQHAQLQFG